MKSTVEIKAALDGSVEFRGEDHERVEVLTQFGAKLKEELVTLSDRYRDQSEELKLKTSALEQLELKFAVVTSEVKDKAAMQAALKEDISELKREIDDHRKSKDVLYSEIATLTRMLEEQSAHLEEKSRMADSYASQLAQLQGAHEKLQSKFDTCSEELSVKRASCTELLKRQGELQQEVASARAENNTRFEEIATLTKMLEELQHAATDHAGKLDAADYEKRALLARVDRLRYELDQQKPNTERLNSVISEKESMIQDRFFELAELTRVLEQKEVEITRLNEALSAYQQRWTAKIVRNLPGRNFLRRRSELRKEKREAAELESSRLFDAEWYLKNYPDLAADDFASKNPAIHYLRTGGFEGRRPSPGFDSLWYLDVNPDVEALGINPLLHYLRHGKKEGRFPVKFSAGSSGR